MTYRENSDDLDKIEVDEEGKPKEYAIKRIFPTINAAYILIEMLVLRLVQGKENITQLLQGFRKGGQVSLVFPYQRSDSFLMFLTQVFEEKDMLSVKYYMKALLLAVKDLEEVGIMHRDIKPSNFLYDKKTRTGLLIDFGLSELSYKEERAKRQLFEKDPSKKDIYQKLDQLLTQLQMKNRTGTKGYMPPESLFHH